MKQAEYDKAGILTTDKLVKVLFKDNESQVELWEDTASRASSPACLFILQKRTAPPTPGCFHPAATHAPYGQTAFFTSEAEAVASLELHGCCWVV